MEHIATKKDGKSLNNREIKNQPHKNETDGSIANARACNLLLQCFAISKAADPVSECFCPDQFPFVRGDMF